MDVATQVIEVDLQSVKHIVISITMEMVPQ